MPGPENVVFLTVEPVRFLHEQSLQRYSPRENRTLTHPALLESAVMTPQQTFDGAYLYPSLPHMAAAYLIGLVCNHAFQNGNKRVGFAACSTFLRLNGYRLTLTQDEAVRLTLRVITHELQRDEVVEMVKNAMESLGT